MDKNFCRQIDEQLIVEDYVAGKLRGELLQKFEQHISYCENHAQAVILEKAMKRGITEFARGEIKAKLRERLKKNEDQRVMFLRYAAILLVAVITPLIIYYQFNIAPDQLTLPPSPIEQYQQTAPVDSITTEKSLKERSEADLRKDTRKKERAITTKQEEEEVKDSGEKETLESISEIPKSVSPMPVGEEKFILPESPVEEEADLADIAAENMAEKPGSAIGNQSVSRAGRGLGKLAATSIRDKESLQTEINTRIVGDSVQIKTCMETYLNGDKLTAYSINLKLTILQNGEIGKIDILDASTRSEELEKCLTTILNLWLVNPGSEDQIIKIKISYKIKIQ